MSGSQTKKALVLVLVALSAGACAAGRAFSRAERAASVSDWDSAVAYYTKAVQAAGHSHPEYKVALQRAMENAALVHLQKARAAEAGDDLELALREYRKAGEYDPLNGEISSSVINLERTIRERAEAAQPKPRIEQMREQARRTSPEPELNPASRQPLDIVFNNATVAAILKFIAQTTGINVTIEKDAQNLVERSNFTVELHGETLEQALNQILTANGLFYKVLDPHTILVIQDTAPKRMAYEEQAVQTFYISHADAQELSTLIQNIVRPPGMINPPSLQVNKTSNTIVARATPPVLKIIDQIIRANDKPRAELVLDVEILEVNRTRAKQYGLDLNDYSANFVFSPEGAPGTTSTSTSTSSTTSSTGVTHTNLMNLNSLRGITRGDFYLSVPAAVIRLLESDSETRLVAKPQLRGSEGDKLTLNLGSQIPVPSTTFGALGTGGVNTIPISSFQLKDVGLNFEITPRVTFEGDIILELSLENSTYLGNINTAGQNLPSFGSRKVTTRLRLRDGESNLLAGLLQTNDSTTVTGFPGLLRLPVFKQLFSSNNDQFTQTDIVMLLTPHVIRSHQLTQEDVNPIYIGTTSNLGVTGPPPLIAAPPAAAAEQPPAAAPPGTPPAGAAQPPAGGPPAGEPEKAAAPVSAEQGPGPTGTLVAATVGANEFRVGGGPYTVPIMVNGAPGISTLTLTIRYNPAILKVRGVQDGTFMRQGGANPAFTQKVDETAGRIDIAFNRPGDTSGAAGGGVAAVILFDAVSAGSSTLAVSGVATGPKGDALQLQFAPANVTVR